MKEQQFLDVIALAVNVIIIWFILDSAKVDIFKILYLNIIKNICYEINNVNVKC